MPDNMQSARHIHANTSPIRVYRDFSSRNGVSHAATASRNRGVALTTRPTGSMNPLMPVLAARTSARLFSTARKTAMEKS